MRWERLSYSNFTDFIRFIIENEWKSVTLSSRIISRNGSFREIDKIDGKVYCCFDDGTDKIKGIILLTFSGLILPVWDNSVSPDAMEESYRAAGKMLAGIKKRNCILGTLSDVEGVRNFIKPEIEAEIEYNLMTAEKPHLLTPPERKKGITVKRAGLRDAEKIFGLEKDYLLEEVVINRNRFSSSAALINLKNNCSSQIVLYAENGGTPVAKANTNALGINYAQIGGVYTDPAYRRKGYSELLMRHLVYENALLNKNSVLFVKKDNTGANNLYRKTGFTEIDSYSIVYVRH